MALGDGKPKPAGTWDWYGSLDPAHHTPSQWMVTFSIGVFQWIPCGKSRPGETKKGKAIRRFSAPVYRPDEAYNAARAWIARQEAAATAQAEQEEE